MVTRDSVGPGTSIPWNSPAVAKRHEVSSSVNRARRAGLGRSSWVSTSNGRRRRSSSAASCIARRLVKRASVRPPAAVMRACELVVDPGLVAGLARVREVGGAVEEGVGGVVERAADVEQLRALERQAHPLRGGSAARWRW